MPHPELDRLRRAMRRCRPMAAPWSGVLFRSTSPEYANSRDLVSGEGSRRTGARWNPPETFAAVYGSLDVATAVAEALAYYRRFGIPEADAMPRVLVAIEAHLTLALDLTSGAVRSRLSLSKKRMRKEQFWRGTFRSPEPPGLLRQAAGQEAVTQAAGRAAFEEGLEALIVPSAPVPRGVNMVVFPANLRAGSRLAIRPHAGTRPVS
jgi:RES domain-containing protein